MELCIAAMTGMISDLTVREARMLESARAGYATATDIADWLVRVANIPFRQAHHITGRVVRLAEERGCTLEHLLLSDLQAIEPAINESVYSVLDPAASAASRTSYGGTAPLNVKASVCMARERFL
jgi:argininosuccinate lyase